MTADRGPRAILLAGEIGSGKTTACQRLVELARCRGLVVAGVLSPPELRGDERVGIWAKDLATGARRRLSVVEPGASRRTVGPYRFDPETVTWANGLLLHALTMPGALVIVDEIGPLELEQGAGFAPALDALAVARCRAVVLVVRQRLIQRLVTRLEQDLAGFRKPVRSLVFRAPTIVALDDTTREALPARILALCGPSA